jgi:hypothetical protein
MKKKTEYDKMGLEDYEVHSTKYLEEVKQVHNIFKKKRQLERDIVELIRQFEDETGIAIDIVRYERDITLTPGPKHYKTDLRIIISSDKAEAW